MKIQSIGVFFLVFLLSGCGVIGLDSGSGEISFVAQPSQSPAEVLTAFLTAWSNKDTAAMYAMVSAQSKALYDDVDFTEFYADANANIGLEGVDFTIDATHLQGLSAAIRYDVTFESSLFDQFSDAGRIIRLVEEDGSWKVAWSPMDIFDGYTANATLQLDSLPQRRGNIFDRNGELLVEENGSISVIYGIQQNMNTVNDCLDLLANLLLTPRYELVGLFGGYLPESRFYIGELDERIEQRFSTELNEFCNINRNNETIFTRVGRRYDGQGGAVHVTGYVGSIPSEQIERYQSLGYRTDSLIGLSGIEQSFETELAGRPSRVLRITEPSGILLRELNQTVGSPPQDVQLTIDRDLQWEVSQTLASAYNYAENNWAQVGISPGAAAVVLDVNSSEILAMASFPTFQPSIFDPNSFAPDRGTLLQQLVVNSRNPFANRAASEQYSPGSVFKIVTTAAVANEGLIQPAQLFDCQLTWDGSTEFGDTFSPRSDWRLTDELDPAGEITISQALTSSCDPFFYEFGARLFLEVGANALVDYAEMMGFDGSVGVQGLREVPGDLAPPTIVEEAINNAIGQGDTQVTVLQTAQMVAMVANGGTVYQPYLVRQVGGFNGQPQTFSQSPTVEYELDFAPGVIDVVQNGMCDVITDDFLGTAWRVFNDTDPVAPYSVCGKTGTAQAGYAPNAWFVAYAPANNPEIAVVVMAQNSREGSEVAAPMVRRILDAYFEVARAPYPDWWQGEYVPLAVPTGGVAGG